MIHRYSKAARALWKLCWSTGSGSQVVLVARTLKLWAAEADAVDWWKKQNDRDAGAGKPFPRPAAVANGPSS